jgi:hypothetical protein
MYTKQLVKQNAAQVSKIEAAVHEMKVYQGLITGDKFSFNEGACPCGMCFKLRDWHMLIYALSMCCAASFVLNLSKQSLLSGRLHFLLQDSA